MVLQRRRVLVLAMGAGLAVLSGCGGGGGATTGSTSAPSTRAKTRVDSISRLMFQGTTTFGRTDLVGALGGPAAGASADASAAPAPMLAGFLKNEALTIGQGQSRAKKLTRDEPMPPIWEPKPSFYKDYYLGLWVQTSFTAGSSRYDLYEDEAKTKPAGSIVTSWPTTWDVFPQIYRSSYEFTAGFLKGSKGSSETVTNEGWSGSSKYDNLYIDGWKDKGESNWSGRGDSSWYSRTESADGSDWTETAGSWRSDGSGGTRMTTADGYEANFTYNRDGSGRGTIKGPEPGLPVTITWDNLGNVTIRYADGTVERFNRWERWYGPYYGGGGTPIAVDDIATTNVAPKL